MPVGNIGYGLDSKGINNLPTNNNTTTNNGNLSESIKKVSQSDYGFNRGHHRSNAVDMRAVSARNPRELLDKLGSNTRISR